MKDLINKYSLRGSLLLSSLSILIMLSVGVTFAKQIFEYQNTRNPDQEMASMIFTVAPSMKIIPLILAIIALGLGVNCFFIKRKICLLPVLFALLAISTAFFIPTLVLMILDSNAT